MRRAGRGRGAEAPGGTRSSPARPPPRVYKSLRAGSASSAVPAPWSAPRTRPAVREFAGPSASVGWGGWLPAGTEDLGRPVRRQVPDAGRRSFQAVGSRGVSGLLRFTFWFPLALPFPIFVCLETLSSCLFAFLGQEFDRRCVVVWGCVCGCVCRRANAVSVVVRVLRTSFFSSPVSFFVLFLLLFL